MTENVKAERKELELREKRANAEKAEIDLRLRRISLEQSERDHRYKTGFSENSRGTFRLYEDVNEDSTYHLMRAVETFAHNNEGNPITLYIYSPGGDVIAGLALYDSLRALSGKGHHITTIVRGYAASMGGVLLQAGDTRIVGPESYVMVHEVSSVAWGKMHEIEDKLAFTKKLNVRLFEILAERGPLTGPELYAKAKATDLWLNAKEAIEDYSLADEVG